MPLIIENHPKDYTGYPFITLIQFRDDHILSIIDNADDKTIRAYVLDKCGPEKVDEETVITIASYWYDKHRQNYPLSFEFSKHNLSQQVSGIYKTFMIEYVSRIIGPIFTFPMDHVKSRKRRRKKEFPRAFGIVRNNLK